MSAAFYYRIERPAKDLRFSNGTSDDREAIEKVFGGAFSTADIPILRAMAAAVRHKNSLWAEIADKLEALGDSDIPVRLTVWSEF